MSNLVTEKLTSVKSERHYLSGLVKFPKVLYETELFISELDFSNKLHETIFLVTKQEILAGNAFDKISLAQKIKNLNISFRDEVDIFSYIDNLYSSQINEAGTMASAKELAKLTVRRDIYKSSQHVQDFVLKCGDKTVSEIIAHSDLIYNEKIKTFTTDENPADLFIDAENLVNERAANPLTEIGLKTGFKLFDDSFGGLRIGVTAICGRAKHNKSTFLSNIAWGGILNQPELKVLYLDSEMKKDISQFRAMSAFSQVPMWWLETGKWIHSPEYAPKIKKIKEKTDKLKGRLFHYYIGNKPVEHVNLVIRKWYFSKVGRGNPALIIYDYIKIGNEKLSNFNAEHQELGRKINLLNETSQYLDVPVVSAMQLNRSAITDNREDESAISMTDRLTWFANGVYILRKKRPDEIAEDGIQFGTHKLIEVVTRFQGKDGGNFDLVKVSETNGRATYKHNFINYQFDNFLFSEKGNLRNIIDSQNFAAPLANPPPVNDPTNI
jgi:replicative DNA helicase